MSKHIEFVAGEIAHEADKRAGGYGITLGDVNEAAERVLSRPDIQAKLRPAPVGDAREFAEELHEVFLRFAPAIMCAEDEIEERREATLNVMAAKIRHRLRPRIDPYAVAREAYGTACDCTDSGLICHHCSQRRTVEEAAKRVLHPAYDTARPRIESELAREHIRQDIEQCEYQSTHPSVSADRKNENREAAAELRKVLGHD